MSQDETNKRVYPRRTTQPKRRQTFLRTEKGANPDDAPGTDINSIVAQYRRNGTLPAVPQNNPLYGDFTGPQDLHDAQIQIQRAQERFAELPSDIRTAADNDEVRFLEMFGDPEQLPLLENAGLVVIKPDPNPTPTPSETPDTPSPPDTNT